MARGLTWTVKSDSIMHVTRISRLRSVIEIAIRQIVLGVPDQVHFCISGRLVVYSK